MQQRRLAVGAGLDIRGPAEHLDVRMPPDHAGSGAWRVEKNPVESRAVPPLRGFCRVTFYDLCLELEPCQVLMDALDALGIQFHRHHSAARARQFQQMPGLAAWSGTGIEDARAAVHQEPRRCDLRGRVLYRYVAVGEARQPGDRQRRGQANRMHEP